MKNVWLGKLILTKNNEYIRREWEIEPLLLLSNLYGDLMDCIEAHSIGSKTLLQSWDNNKTCYIVHSYMVLYVPELRSVRLIQLVLITLTLNTYGITESSLIFII